MAKENRLMRLGSLVMVMLCMACGARFRQPPEVRLSGTHDFHVLDERLITSEDVTVYPGRHWKVSGNGDQWSFRSDARLLVWVQSSSETPLLIDFEALEPTDRFHFDLIWDDVRIGIAERHVFIDDGCTVEIPAQLLTEGVHHLTIERFYKWDVYEDRTLHDVEFSHLGYRHGTRSADLDPKELDRVSIIAKLIETGVTGTTLLKRSGCLFDGPFSLILDLGFLDKGRLTFPVENISSAAADFKLAVGDAVSKLTVGAGLSGDLEVPVEAGTHIARLEVRGSADGLFLWGGSRFSRIQEETLPPIILITLDTTRRDVLSPYGGPAQASPELQDFADRSTVFDSAYATAPWTLPSHVSMMTGLYPSIHTAGVSSDLVGPRHETLAGLLRSSGYFTCGLAGGDMSASLWGIGRDFHIYHDPDGFETRGDALTDAAIDILESVDGQPIFLFVNYFDPHALYRAPEGFQKLFGVAEKRRGLLGKEFWIDFADGDTDAWGEIVAGYGARTPETNDYLRAAYLAEVAFMDEQIGRFFDVLQRLDIFDPALIVVVSDHGEYLGENGFVSHGCRLDPELVEVPLFIKWPYQESALRSDLLVSHVDLFATMLQAAGIAPPPNDGLEIDLQADEPLRKRLAVFMEEHDHRIHPLFPNMMIARHLLGLQRMRHREVVWKGGIECSELRGSIWSLSTCSTDWQERLRQLGIMADVLRDRERGSTASSLSEDERQRLEALGYIN